MSDKSSSLSSGIEFLGLLTIVFIVLKLIGKITWSWVAVLSPLWIPIIIAILVFLIYIFYLVGKKRKSENRRNK